MLNGDEELPDMPYTFSGSIVRSEDHLPTIDCQSVFLRIKPTLEDPLKIEACPFILMDNQTLQTTSQKQLTKPAAHQYTFTKIFDQTVTQEEFFRCACLSTLKDFIKGDNCLLFAYGSSNSGKTHTIQGNVHAPGVIPQSLNVLFNTIQGRVNRFCRYMPDRECAVIELDDRMAQEILSHKKSILGCPFEKSNISVTQYSNKSTLTQMSEDSLDHKGDSIVLNSNTAEEFVSGTFRDMQKYLSNITIDVADQGDIVFSVWVSFAEIYNECIYDLLDVPLRGHKRIQLTLGENAQKNVYIKGLRHILVTSGDEAYQMFLFGQHNLQQAPTNVNHVSSRSHSIFSITLVRQLNVESPSFARVSKCSFVDLAGSERAKKTCNVGERMKESQNINTSLHVLGRCLETIRNNQITRDRRLIPFRESKLTRLFQRALSGKEMITMIVNVNPISSLYEETINVLKFSAIAQQIVFEPVKQKTTPRPSSRFSQYALKSCSVDRLQFESPPSNQSSMLVSLLSMDSANCTPNESLLFHYDKLKQQLKEEQRINLTLEKTIRQDMYNKFSTMLVQMETSWQNRLKDSEERMEDLSAWRVNRLQEYYEHEHKQKRSTTSFKETEDSQMEDLEDELNHMKCQVSTLQCYLKELQIYISELKIRNSELEIKIASTNQELIVCQTLLEASQQSKDTDSEEHMLIQELRNQLEVAQNLAKERDRAVKDTSELLEEAKEEYVIHIKEQEESQKMNQQQEMKIALKDEELDDLKSQLLKCHSKLSQLAVCINRRTDDEAEALDKQQKLLEDRDEYKLLALECKSQKTKLERENDKLKSLIELRESKVLNKDIKALEAQVLSLQDELSISNNRHKEAEKRTVTLEKEILSLKELNSFTIQASHEKEVDMLHKEIKDLLKLKTELREKNKDCLANEKELKNNMKMLTLAEKALEDEKKKVHRLEMSLEAEIQHSQMHKLTYEDNKVFMSSLKAEMERKQELNEELEMQNKLLQDQLQRQETDFDNFKIRRDQQFKVYDDMLRQEREEVEMQKREVRRFQEVFTKSPTPNKMDYLAQISKLKDELMGKTNELKRAKVLNFQLEKEVNYLKIPFEENTQEPTRRTTRSRAAQGVENVDPSRRLPQQDVEFPRADNLEKNKVRRRKLFSATEAVQKTKEEPIPVTSRANTAKRTLRKRQV